MLLAILAFGIVMIPLVIIHELGHFFAAKSVGITVLEFGIGFPPRAATLFTKGDTEYTINWLPLGGFVRPYGEDFVRPQSEDEMQSSLLEIEGRHIENPKSVFEAGPWERIWFFLAGPLFNFIAAIVIFIVIGFTGIPTTIAEVSIAEVFAGSPAEAAGLQAGDIVLSVDGQVIERVSQYNDAVDGKDQYILQIERDGEIIDDVTVTPAPFSNAVEERVLITAIATDSPAEAAGLQVDDVVVSMDGESIINVDALVDYTDTREDVPIVFEIARGADILELEITPKNLDGDVRIGIAIVGAPLDESLGAVIANRDARVVGEPADSVAEAVEYGFTMFGRTMSLMASFPAEIIRGNVSAEEARPVGPVGVSNLGGQIIEESRDEGVAFPFLGFVALISIALAITNLLPIPALDGGRILFVLIELLRGKPIEPEREGLVHMVGILILLSIMVVVTFFDIVDPTNLNSF